MWPLPGGASGPSTVLDAEYFVSKMLLIIHVVVTIVQGLDYKENPQNLKVHVYHGKLQHV